METSTKKIVAATSSLVMAVSCAGGFALAGTAAQADASEVPAAQAENQEGRTSAVVSADKVEGTFSFTQGMVDGVESIAANLASASKHLCGSGAESGQTQAVPFDEWTVSVNGNVENAFSATLPELAEKGAAQLTMGCSCAGNPADGLASANAEVYGATVASIIAEARPAGSVNTVVFTGADGYQVAVPLFYVQQRYSVLAFNLNGEPLANSMGGANQLWLGSTAASYFAQDVVEITFESRQTPPPTPGTAEAGDAYANVPNVSIVQASTSEA